MTLTELASYEIVPSSRTEEWNDWIARLPQRDIYYTAEYARLYEVEGSEAEGEQKAELFVYRQGSRLVVYPYLLRAVNHLPAVRTLGLPGDWYDISSPYGYGGPISKLPPGREREALMIAFSDAFFEYALERRILTEFVRFHPLLGNARDYAGVETRLSRHTASIDLQGQSEAGLLEHYCSNHKKNVRKFRSSPLTIRHTSPGERMDTFIELYYGTMQDLQADPFYYFPRPFLHNTARLLAGRLELFEVCHGEETVAACLVMHEHPYMHYHLSGWNRDYLHWAPTKLLIHAAALWGIEHGFEQFHLGGGYRGDDRLFDFKKGFGTHLPPLEYYLGRRVFFPELYDRLRSELGGGADLGEYFPLYRHPALCH